MLERLLYILQLRLRSLFHRQRVDRDLDEELRYHIEQKTAEYVTKGLHPNEARRRAMLDMDGLERSKEECRDMRRVNWLHDVVHDLRYAARQLRRNPSFTVVIVLTLALSMGACMAIFTVINALLLRPLPVLAPDELALLSMGGHAGRSFTFSYPLYEQLRDRTRTLSGLFAAGSVSRRRMAVVGETEAEFIQTQEVTGNFFSVLGAPAWAGRTLIPEDDRAGHVQAVAVISHSFWQRRFGGDPSAIGKAITLDDVRFTIVGVASPGFFGFEPGMSPDLWWPMQMVPQVVPGFWGRRLQNTGMWWVRVMGRIPVGDDRRQAQEELDVILQQHLSEFAAAGASRWSPDQRKRFLQRRLELLPGNTGWTNLRQQFQRPLLILMAATVLLLLIACTNAASLLLARAAGRTREFSVRSALGAGRLRLVRQVLVESLLISAIGGAAGLFLARDGTHLLLSHMRVPNDPVSFNLAPDARVLGFTALISLFTGLLAGLTPALRSIRGDLAAAIKGGTGSGTGRPLGQILNEALVVAQVALAVLLLTGTGLVVRTFGALRDLDAGFDRRNTILFNIDFTKSLDATGRAALYKELLARLESLPEVRVASGSSFEVLGGSAWTERIKPEGYDARSEEDTDSHGMAVGPHYFAAMGIPLLQGRDFDSRDERHTREQGNVLPRAAIINERMAKRFFGGTNPLGKRFSYGQNPETILEIVGVVKDAKYSSLRDASPPTFYIHFFQVLSVFDLTLVIRTNGDVRTIRPRIPSIVRGVNPALRARDLRTMTDVVDASLHQEKVIAGFGGFFSLAAVALASLGLYGVLSFAVLQRRGEIAIRAALGAPRRAIFSLVMGRGLKLTLIGVVLGLLAALLVSRLVSSLLFGVAPTDPVTYFGVAGFVLLVALTSCWLPAWHAMQADPMVALRNE